MHDPATPTPRSRESWDLWRGLPAPLPADAIVAANQPREDVRTLRAYTYNGWDFPVPPGVFSPGLTSELVFDRLLDGTIPLAGRSYAIMGCGLGVEAVIAAARGTREVHALDVHLESVRCTADHFARLAGTATVTTLRPLTSDLFDQFPESEQVDIITFNPPAVKEVVSDDPDTVRTMCVGTSVVLRFLDQIVDRDLLATGGEVYIVISTTADLRRIIGHAIETGYSVEIAHSQGWDTSEVHTYLFRLDRRRWQRLRPVSVWRGSVKATVAGRPAVTHSR